MEFIVTEYVVHQTGEQCKRMFHLRLLSARCAVHWSWHNQSPVLFVKISAALCLRFIDLTVNLIGGKQLFMCPKAIDPSFIQNKNTVGILYAGYTLGNDQLCRVWNLIPEGPAYICVGRCVDGACTVVENQDLRLFQKGAGDTQTLLLSAGYIVSALLDVGVVSRPGRCWIKSSAQARRAGSLTFFVSGIRIAPAQVVIDAAGEKHIVLKYDGYLISQRGHIVVLYVAASDPYLSGCHIVKTADQGDQTGFCTSGRTDDTDRLAGTDVKCDILKHRLGAVLFIARN